MRAPESLLLDIVSAAERLASSMLFGISGFEERDIDFIITSDLPTRSGNPERKHVI